MFLLRLSPSRFSRPRAWQNGATTELGSRARYTSCPTVPAPYLAIQLAEPKQRPARHGLDHAISCTKHAASRLQPRNVHSSSCFPFTVVGSRSQKFSPCFQRVAVVAKRYSYTTHQEFSRLAYRNWEKIGANHREVDTWKRLADQHSSRDRTRYSALGYLIQRAVRRVTRHLPRPAIRTCGVNKRHAVTCSRE